MSTDKSLAEAQFKERIAKVRVRFISKLADTIQTVDAAFAHLTGDGDDAVAAVASTYRRFHDMAGVGSTIGFEATGRVARTLDALLSGPFRDRRGLRDDELAELKEGLGALQMAVLMEIRPKD
ncbi:Hpt domain-containing protein [Methyloferula stellata]|uniref:Hpt domain-containing protein n=1 Tax=Methyloferula stellata TaxID=876270 RepID=UPI000366449A|nr:Hpt domain-containing protein [Methyloferula stellata]